MEKALYMVLWVTHYFCVALAHPITLDMKCDGNADFWGREVKNLWSTHRHEAMLPEPARAIKHAG